MKRTAEADGSDLYAAVWGSERIVDSDLDAVMQQVLEKFNGGKHSD